MASIIKITDKRSGITYVYESESYWDKVKQQPRARRKLIGKIDPDTGEVVPTDGRGKKRKLNLTGTKYSNNSYRLMTDGGNSSVKTHGIYTNNASEVERKIAAAFLKLCKCKSIKKITVQDIIRESGVARQTFYNHFQDKFELMNYIYQQEAEYSFEYSSTKKVDPKDALYWLLCRVLEKREYYTALVNYDTQNNFENYFFESAVKFYSSYVIQCSGDETLDEPMQRAIEFNVAGARCLFIQWIKSGMKEDPGELAAEILELMPEKMKRYILT